jgi:hypothetical protein
MKPVYRERSMLTQSNLGRLLALIGLSLFGCATPTLPPMLWLAHPLAIGESVAPAPLPAQCPYADVSIAVSTNGAALDAKLAERVQIAYSDYLRLQGFQVVGPSEVAYWSAFSLVSLNRQVTASFAWSVYMTARQDLGGRVQSPFRIAVDGDDQEDLSGFMLLKQVHLLDLDREVRSAAEATEDALLPHASRMCIAWTQSEELREELAQEIQRIREERQQHKQLRFESDEPSDS